MRTENFETKTNINSSRNNNSNHQQQLTNQPTMQPTN